MIDKRCIVYYIMRVRDIESDREVPAIFCGEIRINNVNSWKLSKLNKAYN